MMRGGHLFLSRRRPGRVPAMPIKSPALDTSGFLRSFEAFEMECDVSVER